MRMKERRSWSDRVFEFIREREGKPSVMEGESVLKLEDERKAASGDAATPEPGRGGRISSRI
jgi:hypothetical protein